jgi:hypothetical protein
VEFSNPIDVEKSKKSPVGDKYVAKVGDMQKVSLEDVPESTA